MIAGYHLAGLLQHDAAAAMGELAHIGYSCVAIRPHGGFLNPALPWFSQELLRTSAAASDHHLHVVFDCDGTFVHDAESCDGPSLVAIDADERRCAVDWISHCIRWSVELGSKVVTFRSGKADSKGVDTDEQILERLGEQLATVFKQADDAGIRIALRPRSGDAIATVAHFERLAHWITDHDLWLAADIGEMLQGGEWPIADRLGRNHQNLAALYLCDRKTGHRHDERIGHGDIAIPRILKSLHEHGYDGPAIVRVEGLDHLGLTPAREAITLFER